MTREVLATSLATVRTRRQEWAWQGFVPLGVPTVLAGRGGIGKSTLLGWLTAGLTNGDVPGDLYGVRTPVGFIGAEDDPETTLVPRLKAAGARLEHVTDLSKVRTVNERGETWTGLPSIAEDLPGLRAQIIATGTRVLVIDPIVSMMSGDTIKASDVRRNLDPIAGLAADLGIAIICVAHFNKGSGDASDKLSGSHAFRDIARSVLLLAVDEENDQRVLSVDKSNYSATAPSVAFTITSATIPTDAGGDAVVGVARLLGTSTVSVADILKRGHEDSDNLKELSADLLTMVNEADVEVTVADAAKALNEPMGKVRTYLGRLERAGRIQRSGPGRYTAVLTKKSVLGVPTVSPDPDTPDTDDTPIQALRAVPNTRLVVGF